MVNPYELVTGCLALEVLIPESYLLLLFSLHPMLLWNQGHQNFIRSINLDSYAGFRLSGLNGPSQLCSVILEYIFTLFEPYEVDQIKKLIPQRCKTNCIQTPFM